MKNELTHWRTFFPSDYLGGADLESEDQVLTLTVKFMTSKETKDKNGKPEIVLIANWEEDYKPMIVNVFNSKVLINFSGSKYVQHWAGVKVDVYFNPEVQYMGETTGGLRFKQTRPKEEINPETITYAIKQLEGSETQHELDLCFDGLSRSVQADQRVKDIARKHSEHLKNQTKAA